MNASHKHASRSARVGRAKKTTKSARRNGHHSLLEPLEGRQFFSGGAPALPPVGSVKLTGAVIGTAGSYKSQGNTIANVFDGNTATYFDGPTASGDWVGLDLGTPETITQIQYSPRSGWGGRMVGGTFQASPVADFSSGVVTLATITASPTVGQYTVAPATTASSFEFVRYVAPANGYGNVAELEFDGYLPPAVAPTAPAAPVATVTATDVHLAWTEDPASIVTSFTVERQGPADLAPVVIGTVAGSVNAFDDTTAAPLTGYSYLIVANNSIGSSASAVTLATTPAPFVNSWTDGDIGGPAKAGSAFVSPAGPITVTGGGADIWNMTDQFNFNYQPMVGNGSVITQVTSQTNSNSWAKSGIMIRETTNADSRYVLIALTPGNGVTFQARTATHTTPTVNICVAGKAGVWLELTRNGSSITGSYSTDGVTWKILGTVTIPMVNNVYAGLAVTAHDNTKSCVSTFSNTTITTAGAASAWSDGATAPLARWEAENFNIGGKLYVFGGYDDRNLDATAECDVYDPVANTWTNLGSMPTGALAHSAVTTVGNVAYFAGGDLGTFNRGKTLTSTSEVITYNTVTGQWGSAASLPAAASCGGLVCIGTTLYYYGGINANDTADSAATYSLDLTNPNATWVAEAAMPDARNHVGAVVINGIAYAVGGQHLYNETGGNDSTVDAYNPVTNAWTPVASLPLPLSSIGATTTVVNGKIVVVGGQSNGGYDGIYQSAILEYNPATSLWTSPGSLPEASQSQSVAYIDNELVVVGGTVDNQGGWAQNQTWIDSAITL